MPLQSVSEFASQHHMLPNSSAEPGLYNIARTPYVRDILDCLSPTHPAREVVLWAGTQLGKTEIILASFHYYMVNLPSPMLFASCNASASKDMVKTRINPMIDASPMLSERIASSSKSGRASGDTIDLKEFAGGFLAIGSGESAASLRSKPCRIVALDEIDAMPDDVQGEGDPVDLATRRTSTFKGREKVYVSSTCVNGHSKIIDHYEMTDQRKFFVPCPHCGHMQLISFKRFHWIADGTMVKDVWMECANPKCKGKIQNHHKLSMLTKGEWRSTNKKATSVTSVGFWISGLYAPVGWQDWNMCVEIYLKALTDGGQEKLKSFYNTILAEQYQISAVRPDYALLYELSKKSGYSRGEVPEEVLAITSGADVQDDRIEVEIVGWGRNGRSYSIDYQIFLCPFGTKTDDVNNPVWDEYTQKILNANFVRKDGKVLKIAASAMDRGHNTAQVNALWARCRNDRFHLVRGEARMRSEISSVKHDKGGTSKRTASSKEYRGSEYLYFDVGVSTLKARIYQNLQVREQVGDNGKFVTDTPYRMYFPDDYDDEFFKQLTSEEYRPPKGTSKFGIWEKIRDRNEALDCRVYATAMWYKLELYRFTASDYDELEKRIKEQASSPSQTIAVARQRTARVLSKGLTL